MVNVNSKGELYCADYNAGDVKGDATAIPMKSTPGFNGDTYGADTSTDATNGEGSFSAKSDGVFATLADIN